MIMLGVLALLLASTVQGDVLIKIDKSNVQGFTKEYSGQNVNGTYYSFQGIPYAKPPIDFDTILKDPQPWEGPGGDDPINTRNSSMCIQMGLLIGKPGEIVGDLDCLHLSIYTTGLPSLDSGIDLKPVFFWIHGGAFQYGNGDFGANPDYLLESGLVVVTINYRLGPFGFFAHDKIKGANGNQGLKDQLMALRWVKKNIASFGGDPSRITIAGESAGAMSVHAHVLSPLGKDEDLFHGAISFSGTMLFGSDLILEAEIREMNKMFMEELDEQHQIDTDNFWSCAQKTHCLEKIMGLANHAATKNLVEKYLEKTPSFYMFWPSIDSMSESPFLPRHPINILHNQEQKMVPYMTGINKDEGAMIIAPLWKLMNPENNTLQQYWDDAVCQSIFYNNFEVCKQKKLLTKVFTKFYLGGSQGVTRENKQSLIDIFTDALMAHPNTETVKLHAQASVPVYNYLMTYRGSMSISPMFAAGDEEAAKINFGVVHADDLGYTWKWGWDKTDEDKAYIQIWQKLISNFVKYGNPTPIPLVDGTIWKKAQDSKAACIYMDINTKPQEKHRMFAERMEFWNKMVFQDILDKYAVDKNDEELLEEISEQEEDDDDHEREEEEKGNGHVKRKRGGWRKQGRRQIKKWKRLAKKLRHTQCQ